MVEKNKFVKANEFDPLDPIYEGLQDEITNKTAFELLQSLAGSIQTLQGVQLPTETEIVGDSITVDRYYTKITTAGTLSSVNVAIINGGDAILDGGVIEIVLPTGTTVINSTDINGIQTYSGTNIVTTDNYVLTLIRNGGKWQETTNANVFVDTIKQIANLAQSTANTANAMANSALSGLNGKFDKTGGAVQGDTTIFGSTDPGGEYYVTRRLASNDDRGGIALQSYLHKTTPSLSFSEINSYDVNNSPAPFNAFRISPRGLYLERLFDWTIPAPIPTSNAGLGYIDNIEYLLSYTVHSGKWWCYINSFNHTAGTNFKNVANGVYDAGTTFYRFNDGGLFGFAMKIKEG